MRDCPGVRHRRPPHRICVRAPVAGPRARDRATADAAGRRGRRPRRCGPVPALGPGVGGWGRGERGRRHPSDHRGRPSRRIGRLVRDDRQHHRAAVRIPRAGVGRSPLRAAGCRRRRVRPTGRPGPGRRGRPRGHRSLGLGVGVGPCDRHRRWFGRRRRRRHRGPTGRRAGRAVRLLRARPGRDPRHLAHLGARRFRLERLCRRAGLRARGPVGRDRPDAAGRAGSPLPLLDVRAAGGRRGRRGRGVGPTGGRGVHPARRREDPAGVGSPAGRAGLVPEPGGRCLCGDCVDHGSPRPGAGGCVGPGTGRRPDRPVAPGSHPAGGHRRHPPVHRRDRRPVPSFWRRGRLPQEPPRTSGPGRAGGRPARHGRRPHPRAVGPPGARVGHRHGAVVPGSAKLHR